MVTRSAGTASAVAVLLVLGGCGDDAPAVSPTATVTTSVDTTSSETSSSQASSAVFEEVEFSARDGEMRKGRLFGNGSSAIVLSHMGNPGNSQDDWVQMASEFAERGYQVLTYDRRPELSDGWLDVLGAVAYVRDRGAELVVAGGASIGAMASMRAAEELEAGISGVIWLAGVLSNSGYLFEEADVSKVACPVLIISAEDDSYGADDDAKELHTWLPQTSELVMIDSFRHGTNIFDDGGSNASTLREAMVEFVERVVTAPLAPC